ncbi:MAG TPA: DinB family protein [Thermomicrobiaceae bacterium]|nr:DinB family protein [Thermomicrobiaceae bacterium]
MLADLLRMTYDYNAWANAHIFDAAAQLNDEQLNAPGDAGHGSIRGTLFHMLNAHKGWFSWFDGSFDPANPRGDWPDLDAYPDIASLRAYWDELDAQTTRFLAGLTDEDAEQPKAEQPSDPQFPLWQYMLHVANHGTQHRSEVAAMLTAHGYSPGGIDMIFYMEEKAQAAQGGA